MSLIRRFVNMNYCSEDEAILVPDSDSDIPPRAQAMGKVAFRASKYTCLEGHLEHVRRNKQDFHLLLLHDFSNSV